MPLIFFTILSRDNLKTHQYTLSGNKNAPVGGCAAFTQNLCSHVRMHAAATLQSGTVGRVIADLGRDCRGTPSSVKTNHVYGRASLLVSTTDHLYTNFVEYLCVREHS